MCCPPNQRGLGPCCGIGNSAFRAAYSADLLSRSTHTIAQTAPPRNRKRGVPIHGHFANYYVAPSSVSADSPSAGHGPAPVLRCKILGILAFPPQDPTGPRRKLGVFLCRARNRPACDRAAKGFISHEVRRGGHMAFSWVRGHASLPVRASCHLRPRPSTVYHITSHDPTDRVPAHPHHGRTGCTDFCGGSKAKASAR